MRHLYADMYRSTSTIVECTTLSLMPLDLNLLLEFHRSECQLDLRRVYFVKDTVRRPRIFKKLVLIFSTSLVPLPDGFTPTRRATVVRLHALEGQGGHHLMPLSYASMLLIILFSRAIYFSRRKPHLLKYIRYDSKRFRPAVNLKFT
jgi:hypothetical protein